MKLGVQVGLVPGHIVLDMGTQLPLPQTGTPPFRPMSIVATVAHLSYCSALVQVGCPGPLFGGRLQLPHMPLAQWRSLG